MTITPPQSRSPLTLWKRLLRAAEQRPLWIVLGPVCFIATDMTVTLLGQPADYWAGDRAAAIEANPIPRLALVQHPALFVLHVVCAATLLATALRLLPAEFAKRVSLFAMGASTVAISTWFRMWWSIDGLIKTAVVLILIGLIAAAWRRPEPSQAITD